MSSVTDKAHAAPGELEEVRAFINTLEPDNPDEDMLAEPGRATAWLREHGLLRQDEAVAPVELEFLRGWRASLRNVALANNGAPEEEAASAWADLSARAAQVPVSLSVGRDSDHASIEPTGNAAQRVAGRLAALVYDAMKAGRFKRLKACPLTSCLFAFYDHSKNASATWCSMAVCGNRAKARRRRERQKAGSIGEHSAAWQPSA